MSQHAANRASPEHERIFAERYVDWTVPLKSVCEGLTIKPGCAARVARRLGLKPRNKRASHVGIEMKRKAEQFVALSPEEWLANNAVTKCPPGYALGISWMEDATGKIARTSTRIDFNWGRGAQRGMLAPAHGAK